MRKAFTLIEFIVVMTIIGILAAMIVPKFIGRVGGAKRAVAQQKIHVLEGKVNEFQVDCGRYPTAQEGLWFTAGSLAQCRIYSKYLALQIKAREAGLVA